MDAGQTHASSQSALNTGMGIRPAAATSAEPRKETVVQMDRLLDVAIKRGASDIHLIVGKKPIFREHGDLVELDTRELTANDLVSCVRQIAPDDKRQALQERMSADFGYQHGNTRFRVNACYELGGTKLSMRRLPETLLTLEQIGIPPQLKELLNAKRGLILVTGETGSGKTTTLASLINHISKNASKTIVTIEEPIEYRLPHGKSIVMQREVGAHVKDFHAGLRDALRQDPEVIMVGELRDLETIRVALTAAETGHLVFGTLHTNSAHQTINRLMDVFPEGERDQVRVQVSMGLQAVLCQQLVERADGKGRVAAMEFMVNNSAIANHIRSGQPQHIISAIQTGGREGMFRFDDHLFRLVNENVVTVKTALEYSHKPKELEAKLNARGKVG